MLAPGGLLDECVRTEFGSYVEELDVTSTFAGVGVADADFDTAPVAEGCLGCPAPKCTRCPTAAWTNAKRTGKAVPFAGMVKVRTHKPEVLTGVVVERTPDLMSILTPRKEPLMLTAAPERAALPAGPPVDDDAVALLNALEAASAIEPPKPKPERRVTRVVHSTGVPLLDKIVADVDAEIARLEAFKAILLETRP